MNCYDDSNTGRTGTMPPRPMGPRPWEEGTAGSFCAMPLMTGDSDRAFSSSPMMPARMEGSPCSRMMPRPAAEPSDCALTFSEKQERFPIGMGYVPWQTWQQPYSLEQGFRRATIFPELDLPFMMGRCR